MNRILVISRDSEAGIELARALADPDTYKVSIDERSGNRVAIKVNEQMWSPALSTEYMTTHVLTYTCPAKCGATGPYGTPVQHANHCPLYTERVTL